MKRLLVLVLLFVSTLASVAEAKPGEPIKGVGVIIQRRPNGSPSQRATFNAHSTGEVSGMGKEIKVDLAAIEVSYLHQIGPYAKTMTEKQFSEKVSAQVRTQINTARGNIRHQGLAFSCGYEGTSLYCAFHDSFVVNLR